MNCTHETFGARQLVARILLAVFRYLSCSSVSCTVPALQATIRHLCACNEYGVDVPCGDFAEGYSRVLIASNKCLRVLCGEGETCT